MHVWVNWQPKSLRGNVLWAQQTVTQTQGNTNYSRLPAKFTILQLHKAILAHVLSLLDGVAQILFSGKECPIGQSTLSSRCTNTDALMHIFATIRYDHILHYFLTQCGWRSGHVSTTLLTEVSQKIKTPNIVTFQCAVLCVNNLMFNTIWLFSLFWLMDKSLQSFPVWTRLLSSVTTIIVAEHLKGMMLRWNLSKETIFRKEIMKVA